MTRATCLQSQRMDPSRLARLWMATPTDRDSRPLDVRMGKRSENRSRRHTRTVLSSLEVTSRRPSRERASPPMVKPKPVTVRSSRPGTGRELIRVTAAKPAAARTAMPALARTAAWLSRITSAYSRWGSSGPLRWIWRTVL